MLGILSFFELRMYFIPGFMMSSILITISLFFFPSTIEPFTKLGGIQESVFFIFSTYLCGILVQTIANGFKIKDLNLSPTLPIEYWFWGSGLPSRVALIPNSLFFRETQRLHIIAMARKDGILSEKEAICLENEPDKDISHAVFYSRLKDYGDRLDSSVKITESFYLMLRGLYTVSLLVTIALSILIIITYFAPCIASGIPSGSIFAGFLLTTFIFGYRFKQTAEGLVKEILYTFLKEKDCVSQKDQN